MNQDESAKRLHGLDSLRGVAALTVVLHHFLFITPTSVQLFILRSPLRILVAGHEAVVLFFVLSGFVLTLPYVRHSDLNYACFLLKRVCRIYLPYLAALALSVAGDLSFRSDLTNSLWISRTWSQPVTVALVLRHVLFLGNYDWLQFNTAFWSLVYEMRISLIFPFIALGVLYLRARWSVIGAIAVSIVSLLPASLVHSTLRISQLDAVRNMMTLHYAAFFILGALLARNSSRVNVWYGSLRPTTAAFLTTLALLLYAPARVPRLWQIPIPGRLFDWVTAASAFFFIIMAMNSGLFYRFLTSRAIHHLGTISYSLYLIHGTVLFALIHTCLGRAPLLPIFLLYLVITIATAELFYRLVERPTTLLGRRLTSSRRLRHA